MPLKNRRSRWTATLVGGVIADVASSVVACCIPLTSCLSRYRTADGTYPRSSSPHSVAAQVSAALRVETCSRPELDDVEQAASRRALREPALALREGHDFVSGQHGADSKVHL